MKTLIRLSLCLLPLAASSLQADDRSYAAQHESSQLKTKEVEADFAETKRDPKRWREAITFSQMALGAFGFGAGPFTGVLDLKTRNAILSYQRVRKLSPTGELDAKTAVALGEDYSSWTESLPNLSGNGLVFVTLWDSGYVGARGTWTRVGERLAFPLQTSEIQCHKDLRVCFEATAIYRHKEDFLTVFADIYRIERWDDHEIITKPNDALCVRTTLRIARLEKSARSLGLRINTSEPSCGTFEPEAQSRLVDGVETTLRLAKEKRARSKLFLQAPGLPDEP